MRYPPNHKGESRKQLLATAGRAFRAKGFAGVGVDGLVKGSGVTSGAFYGHFQSKAEAFRLVVAEGLRRLKDAVARGRTRGGSSWLAAFGESYLGVAHRRDVAGGCALPSLSVEVGRADKATKEVYEAELLAVADLVAVGLGGDAAVAREKAWVVLSLLAGGVILCRAVANPEVANDIAAALQREIRQWSLD
jgi:TetR/AcrR family transcriptional repressor of nem operon